MVSDKIKIRLTKEGTLLTKRDGEGFDEFNITKLNFLPSSKVEAVEFNEVYSFNETWYSFEFSDEGFIKYEDDVIVDLPYSFEDYYSDPVGINATYTFETNDEGFIEYEDDVIVDLEYVFEDYDDDPSGTSQTFTFETSDEGFIKYEDNVIIELEYVFEEPMEE